MNKRIAIILPTLSQTIEQDIIRGIQQSFQNQKVSSVFIPIGYLDDEEHFSHQQLWLIQQLERFKIDGVILYGGGVGYKTTNNVMQSLLSELTSYPIINIGSVLPNITSVLVDNYSGMLPLAQHLITQGCREFVYFDGPKHNFEAQQRAAAVIDALTDAGITLAAHNHLYGDMTTARAKELCRHWLAQNNKLPCAMMCTNDLTAKGVIEELQQQQIAIPQQVKVTGFDNFEYANSMQPSLTTAIYPSQDTGALAAQLMIKKLGGAQLNLEYHINTQPILRESSGSHPKKTTPGSSDIQLRQIIQQRDCFAQRLAVTKLLHLRESLMEVLLNAQPLLAELGITEIYIYQLEFDDHGKKQCHLTHSLQPESCPINAPLSAGLTLPLETNNNQHLWVLSEIKNNKQPLGYILALAESAHSEFIEFIAPQIADLIDHQRLISNTKQYQQQAQLSEKMAALGGLVSGVAHEINTPLGNSLLAASHLHEQIDHFNQQVKDNKLSKSYFNAFISEATATSDIIVSSAQRAAELITSFKHVAVDLSYEEQRTINLANYIDDVIRSLQHQLKGTTIHLIKQLAPHIELHTYPGAIAQVITNLFTNAIQHGFDNKTRSGTIFIALTAGKNHHTLTLSDNGKGTDQETLNHIFEPFYTTARGSGGCGLGMHIVFNIITQKLKWLLNIESQPEQGFKVTLTIPTSQTTSQ